MNENLENGVKENPSYYAIIPATVRYDNRLNFGARLLYGEITCLSNKKGYCYANNFYFANLYNVSKSTISEWIKQLKEFGYIDVNILYKDGSKEILQRKIYLKDIFVTENTDTYSENIPTPSKNNITPTDKKPKDNITSINNININKGELPSYLNEEDKKNIHTIKLNIIHKLRSLIEEIKDCPDFASYPPTFNANRYLYDSTIHECMSDLTDAVIDEFIAYKTMYGGIKIGLLNKQLLEFIRNRRLNKKVKEKEEIPLSRRPRPKYIGGTYRPEVYLEPGLKEAIAIEIAEDEQKKKKKRTAKKWGR